MVSVCSFSACCWKSFGINCSWEGHALPNRFRELWFSFQLAGGFTALISDLKNAERERGKKTKEKKEKEAWIVWFSEMPSDGRKVGFLTVFQPSASSQLPLLPSTPLGGFLGGRTWMSWGWIVGVVETAQHFGKKEIKRGKKEIPPNEAIELRFPSKIIEPRDGWVGRS